MRQRGSGLLGRVGEGKGGGVALAEAVEGGTEALFAFARMGVGIGGKEVLFAIGRGGGGEVLGTKADEADGGVWLEVAGEELPGHFA